MLKRDSLTTLLVKQYPFAVLLGALLLIILGAPLAEQIPHGDSFLHSQVATAPFVFILTVASALATWSVSRHRLASIAYGGGVLVLLSLSTLLRHDFITSAHFAAQAIFTTFVIFVIVRRVFSSPVVDSNILCGAASVYLLIGVLMGFLFCLVEIADPGSFTIASKDEGTTAPIQPTQSWLIYYSFTTLTTVGLGDVLPSSDLARSVSIFEAVIGQMVLVIMMARLVGLNVAHVSTRSDRQQADSPPRDQPH